MTEMDKKLLKIANEDWDKFVILIGEDSVISAKVCIMRQEDKSYGEISIRLNLTKQQVRYACGQCENKKPSSEPDGIF